MEQVTSPTAAQSMLRLITGSWVAQAIYVAAKLDIAERLVAGPQSSETLAGATGSIREPSIGYSARSRALEYFERTRTDSLTSRRSPSPCGGTCPDQSAPLQS